MHAWIKLLIFVVVTATLTRLIPFSEFFRNVYTLMHEMSHAAATLLLSGKVMFIHLYADQSGVTHSMIIAGWRSIPIALAGYTGAALFAWFLFYLLARGKEVSALLIVAAIAGAALVLFVRNPYGMAWCAGFTVVTLLIFLFAARWLRVTYATLIAFICLLESIFSSFYILILAAVEPAGAGDATNLAHATPLPSIAWGLFFVLFSLWCAKNATSHLFRSIFSRKSEKSPDIA